MEALCENMQFYPPARYLTGDDLLFEFDPGLVRRCAGELAPEKANVFLSAREVKEECDKVEPWFGTR